jgi:hypothetical protein
MGLEVIVAMQSKGMQKMTMQSRSTCLPNSSLPAPANVAWLDEPLGIDRGEQMPVAPGCYLMSCKSHLTQLQQELSISGKLNTYMTALHDWITPDTAAS